MVYTIAIDGIIGCGKSSLISELARDFTCFPEPIHEWSLLSDFYNQMSIYAAPFQFQVLFSFHKMFSAFKNVNDKIIIERCPWSSKNIFTSMLVEEEYISEEEHRMYLDFYDRLGFNVDMHIYLKVDPTIAYQRIMQRDRAAERTLQFGYLKALYNKYEEQISQLENVYIVDAYRSLDEVKASVVKILEDPSI